MAYENESLEECCTRIIRKLVPKCEKIDGAKKNCLQRMDEFEDRCSICQATCLLSFLRDEAKAIKNADRDRAEHDRLVSFQINALGGYG